MEFVNETGVQAGWTLGFDREGRELVVVAIKATFDIPRAGETPMLSEVQVPLIEADEFSGDPGWSAPVREVDFAHHKPQCDVLIHGSAYAAGPGHSRVIVGVGVSTMRKAFVVTGPRQWRRGVLGITPGQPEAFTRAAISYDNAYGGTDSADDARPVKAYRTNPVGLGYRPYQHGIDGAPMPITEELDAPVTETDGGYRPMSFGPIGRSWSPRAALAGTYDDAWRDRRAPFWPADFDDRYFQSAPQDQQIAHPVGGEVVTLRHLTPDGHVAFALPRMPMPVRFVPHKGREQLTAATIDTIVIEPDEGRFTMTYRASQAMRRSCFDLRQVIAGEPSAAWFRARRLGNKPYYRSLAELVRNRRP
ncbi:DUF2169 family type VI secretion system accessory protein [Roseateles chitosanitabidus]|uniref:DUF2169 family type VI secretion system accessory protein n=1 Tax=Roseateles chitosanitabidus TaxID=65048 RepID=UPI000831FADD|nr:DUF2169 domain-containing protein [Roseateles chitosanitabidus]